MRVVREIKAYLLFVLSADVKQIYDSCFFVSAPFRRRGVLLKSISLGTCELGSTLLFGEGETLVLVVNHSTAVTTFWDSVPLVVDLMVITILGIRSPFLRIGVCKLQLL